MPIAKTCVVCGQGFCVPPNRSATAMTCSRACKGKQTTARYTEARIERSCDWCGKLFNYPQNEDGKRKHCSYACADKSKVGTLHYPLVEDGRLRKATDEGYIMETCREHPYAVGGAVFQHRLVMERALREQEPRHPFLETLGGQRYLRPEIDVHHINEAKGDNALSNLIACTSACHKDLHAGKVPMRGELWPEPRVTRPRESRALSRHCAHCGGAFSAKLSTVKRGGGLYCSRSCYETNRSVAQPTHIHQYPLE